MAGKKTKDGRSWGVALFGLPFLLAGLAVLVVSPLDTLRLHFVSGSWAQVPATLNNIDVISSRGSDSTTYRIAGSYSYTFAGSHHQSSRISYDTGSDNIGNDHYDIVSRIKSRQQRGTLTAWVNPAQPNESFLVRELRWKKVLFSSVFGLVFAGIGAFVMVSGLRKSSSHAVVINGVTMAAPVYSSEKNSYWIWWVFGSLFLLMPLPALIDLPAELGKENYLILLVLLFPLVGGWLIWLGIRTFRSWRHYGPLPVQMDPAPGQIGGDVGGTIELREPWRMENPYRLTLQCLRSKVTGSGKNRSRSESLVWQQELVPFAEASAAGTLLQFVFTPPEHLPESEAVSNDYHLWRLLLCGPGKPIKLERTYNLPVAKGTVRSRVDIPTRHIEQQSTQARIRALEAADSQIQLTQLGDGMRLHSPFGLHLGMKVTLLVAGIVFAAAAAFLTHTAMQEGGMLWFMALVFSLFGYPMMLGGLFTVGRSLTTEIRAGQIRTVRRWFGIPLWRRQMELLRADQLKLAQGVKSNNGRRHTEYLHLVAEDQGRKIRLAEDISGREAAEALRDSLIRLLGLH
ncbi:MAG: DUF3592 domain-containing protein [Alcanivoracaceae bacterium]|nr:DUF3592 domain-containing protein [Alcanivoracaceae bacterium]